MMRQKLVEMTKQVKQLAIKDETCRLLMTIPGVGPVISSAYIATIDDPKRFSRGGQGVGLSGPGPVDQSVGRNGVSRANHQRRRSLIAMVAGRGGPCATHPEPSGQCAESLGLQLAKRKGGSKAKVAVARKLAAILHRIWLTGKPFDAFPT
jgi:transposase